MTRIRKRLPEEVFEQVFTFVLRRAVEYGLVQGKTIAVDATTLEANSLATAARIENCLAIDLAVAWHIVHLTMLGRQTPDLPCTLFLEGHEWKALYAFVHRSKAMVPPQAPPLREAMRMVATLGGFLGRKSDGEPETKSLWLGLQRLDDIALCWLAYLPDTSPHSATHARFPETRDMGKDEPTATSPPCSAQCAAWVWRRSSTPEAAPNATGARRWLPRVSSSRAPSLPLRAGWNRRHS